MPAWKSLLSVLALTGSAVSCAHHGDTEVVPEHEREELLKKWDQEVLQSPTINQWTNPSISESPANKSSGPSPASPALPTSAP